MDISQPVSTLSGVGPALTTRLQKLHLESVYDLLTHIPFRYEDRSLRSSLDRLQVGEQCTIAGTVVSCKNDFTRTGKTIQKAVISDGTRSIDAIWFNQRFLPSTLRAGLTVGLYGRYEFFGKQRALLSPDYEIKHGNEFLHMGRIIGVYPETAGISSKYIRSLLWRALNQLTPETGLPDQHLPNELLPWLQAIKTIHFPATLEATLAAKARLAYDELVFTKLQSELRKRSWQTTRTSTPFPVSMTQKMSFITQLPFIPTSSQQTAMAAVEHDLNTSTPMNRLLEGDVGSGKTVIAAYAAYIAAQSQAQSLLLAPTQILATQHFQTLSQLLAPHHITVSLVTGSRKLPDARTAHVVVGTHALLTEELNFSAVGLVVIDEQHRFGVVQRALLARKGQSPHLLSMTATPIPRTVALVKHGDLDISWLDQPPSGRLPVKTWLVPETKRAASVDWIKSNIINHNSQAFVVCPFVEPSESASTVKAATVEHARLQQEFAPLSVGLLHGKLKSKEKDQILAQFRENKLQILVATPVVEVGIDIPNATIMVIEAAERFGLSQLHQLRGRVGRGSQQSYCLLFAAHDSERLQALVRHHSGHELAEIDFRLRGAGEMYGTAQHGQSEFKIATFADFVHIEAAGNTARYLLDHLGEYPLLKKLVQTAKIDVVQPN